MTRINAGIPVEKLSDQHLLAEHREIKRIPRTTFKGVVPGKFTLGKGHVLFFSDKPRYTFGRYTELYDECHRRGFNVEYYGDNWSFPNDNVYIPSPSDSDTVKQRIIERATESKQIPRYYSKPISLQKYIDLLS
jgi:deoxyribonuclease (pyrimidine dimer)